MLQSLSAPAERVVLLPAGYALRAPVSSSERAESSGQGCERSEEDIVSLEFPLSHKGEADTQDQERQILHENINQISTAVNSIAHSVHFETYEESGELYAQIIDAATNEVIKSIPSEEALSMLSRIQSVLGSLVDREI